MQETTFSGPHVLGSLAFAILFTREVFDFVSRMKGGKNGKNGNGHAGSQSVDYWRNEFRAAIREEAATQEEMLKDIRDGVNELVILERRRQS